MANLKLYFSIWMLLFAIGDAAVEDNEHLASHSILYGLASLAEKSAKNTICLQQISSIKEGLVNGSRWAVKIFDASGTPRTGLHWGNTYWLGNKLQCEANMIIKDYLLSPLSGPIQRETSESISPFPLNYYGAYFVHKSDVQVIVHFKNEFRITLGLCLPSSCEESQISELLQKYFDSNTLYFQKLYNTTLKVENTRRIANDSEWFDDSLSIVLGSILLILIILSVVGTVYDVKIYRPLMRLRRKKIASEKQLDSNFNVKKHVTDFDNQDKADCDLIFSERNNGDKQICIDGDINLGYKILACFSTYTNNKFIFNTESREDSINSIHGIRFFSMVYIIAGHTIYFLVYYFDNRAYPYFIKDTTIGRLFSTSHFSTDGYFCISGYLLTYFFLKTESHKNMNGIMRKSKLFFEYLLKRYLRIVPSYLLAIILTASISSWQVKSTIFWLNENDGIVCRKYWWRNLLFINNFYTRDEMCQAWSWYLSNDMQFYIFISLLLIISVTNLKLATSILAFIFVSCIGYGAYATYIYEYIPILDRMHDLREVFYDPPWMRINPYIVGTVAGYISYKIHKTLPLSKLAIRLLWTCSLCFTLIMIIQFGDCNMSLFSSILYVPLSRPLWAVNVAWIIIACETGNGGIVNSILSYKLWIPLSRLTYWTFLLNPIIIFVYGTMCERTLESAIHSNLILSTGFIAWTYGIAYVFALILEMPCAGICKTVFNHYKIKNLNKKSSQKNGNDYEKVQ